MPLQRQHVIDELNEKYMGYIGKGVKMMDAYAKMVVAFPYVVKMGCEFNHKFTPIRKHPKQKKILQSEVIEIYCFKVK